MAITAAEPADVDGVVSVDNTAVPATAADSVVGLNADVGDDALAAVATSYGLVAVRPRVVPVLQGASRAPNVVVVALVLGRRLFVDRERAVGVRADRYIRVAVGKAALVGEGLADALLQTALVGVDVGRLRGFGFVAEVSGVAVDV